MDASEKQLGAKFLMNMQFDKRRCNISAIRTCGNKILIADRTNSEVVMMANNFQEIGRIGLKDYDPGYWGIADMTTTKQYEFAFIVPGLLFHSQIQVVRINGDKMSTSSVINAGTRSYAIAYRDEHFFVTNCTFFGSGCIIMLDRCGNQIKKIGIDEKEKSMFSRSLSKLYVDNNRIIVSDHGSKKLKVLHVSYFNRKCKIVAEQEYGEVNDISIKGDGKYFLLATKGNQSSVNMLSPSGVWTSQIQMQKDIEGTPKAICYLEQEKLLLIASEKKNDFAIYKVDYIDNLPNNGDVTIAMDN